MCESKLGNPKNNNLKLGLNYTLQLDYNGGQISLM